jgi:hypothetical protein
MENILDLQRIGAPSEIAPGNSNYSVACQVDHSTVSYQCGKALN